MKILTEIFCCLIFLVFASGIINFVNFMDGIDGLVAGCMVIIFTTISLVIDNSFLIIAISLLAFLFFNWASKIFMGDVEVLYWIYLCFGFNKMLKI